MARFTLPRDIYHGKGSIRSFKNFRRKKSDYSVGGGGQ